jgi:hypothetical protein
MAVEAGTRLSAGLQRIRKFLCAQRVRKEIISL